VEKRGKESEREKERPKQGEDGRAQGETMQLETGEKLFQMKDRPSKEEEKGKPENI